MERIRIGNDIAISWALFENNGATHLINAGGASVSLNCGGYTYLVPSFSVQGNVVSFIFPAEDQAKTGKYKIVLTERNESGLVSSYDVRDAFVLVPENEMLNVGYTQQKNVEITSVITHAAIANIKTISIVESEEEGGDNVVTFVLTDGSQFPMTVKNGSKGDKGDKGDQGIQGEKGDKGDTGARGPAGIEEAEVTVDATTGTPAVQTSVVDGKLNMAFSGLKGEKGDKGEQGNSGFQGDYTDLEIVNGLEETTVGKALDATQGKALDGKISQLGQYVDNPEWVRVVTDNDGKILYGVKSDGKFYFGADCPPQIQEYVQLQIDSIGATKVDKVTGKSLIDANFASSQNVIENPEWLQMTTDSEGRVLEGINGEGEKEINIPLKKLNLTKDGMTALVKELEEHGIAANAVTQEELTQQLSEYYKTSVTDSKYAVKSIEETVSQNTQDIAAIEASIDVNPPAVVALRDELDGVEARVDAIEQAGGLTPPTLNLYKKISSELILTQAELNSWEGHVVEVIADLILTGSNDLHLPQNCVIYMNGGRFVNEGFNSPYHLYLENAFIKAEPYQIFPKDTLYSGQILADVGYVEWFGAKGDGETWDGWAFNLFYEKCKCNECHLLSKTYILEQTAFFNTKVSGVRQASGLGTILKRISTFVDVPILSAIDSSTVVGDTATLEVDTTSAYYSQLKVGMMVSVVNREGGSRYLESRLRVIKSINGSTIVCKGETLGNTASANTTSLVSDYPLVRLQWNATLSNVIIEGGLDVIPYNRAYWENCYSVICNGYSTVEDCVINNSVADAILCTGGGKIIIKGNKIFHSGANGIHYSGCVGCVTEGNYIFDSNINPLTGHNEGAITYSNCVANIFIHNNIFDTCRNGIGSIDSADNCKSIITDNLFINFREHGIQAHSVASQSYGNIFRDYIITGNRFVATMDYVDSWEIPYHDNNAIGGQTPCSGYGVFFEDSVNGSFENVIVNNNIFRDCGVYIGNCVLGTIQGNSMISYHTFDSIHPENMIKSQNSNLNIVDNIIKVTSNIISKLISVINGKLNISNNMYNGSVPFSDTGANINLNNNIEF